MVSSALDADNQRAYELVTRRCRQCAGCRHQVSLTSGTILHRAKSPLTHWFWAAYLMTTDKGGVSALLVQGQLGLSCYETAWMMLHKLRRAMVNAARLMGTYHGVSRAQLRVYLDEFVFRHNRRKQPAAAFQTLLGLGTGRTSTEYRRIRGGRT